MVLYQNNSLRAVYEISMPSRFLSILQASSKNYGPGDVIGKITNQCSSFLKGNKKSCPIKKNDAIGEIEKTRRAKTFLFFWKVLSFNWVFSSEPRSNSSLFQTLLDEKSHLGRIWKFVHSSNFDGKGSQADFICRLGGSSNPSIMARRTYSFFLPKIAFISVFCLTDGGERIFHDSSLLFSPGTRHLMVEESRQSERKYTW